VIGFGALELGALLGSYLEGAVYKFLNERMLSIFFFPCFQTAEGQYFCDVTFEK